ncbi:MAG: C4-type zinc ribbon domain-containing protein [Lentimicrobiaceae bacterium]
MAKSSKEKSTSVNEPIQDQEQQDKSYISAHVSSSASESDETEISIEKKLIALYSLQQIDSQIDKIKIIRGELPLEVEDLEDEIVGLQTRIDNYVLEIESLNVQVKEKGNQIVESQAQIKYYDEQQMKVRNNREYDSISKEIEYQNLEIALAEKRIKEFTHNINLKNDEIASAQKVLDERTNDLEIKKSELSDIVNETEKEENNLFKKSEDLQRFIEERLLTAYKRIRKNARNGLAVVSVERDACGGCFSAIPPQRQLDIRMHKKIIVCEYCGRILIDHGLASTINQ